MRLAVLADIHGNRPALDAVQADMAGRRVAAVINLGDCVSGPLWPRETAAVLRRLAWPTVRGNHDRLAGSLSALDLGPSDAYAHAALDAADRAWLRALPRQLRLAEGILALHACPDHDDAYLLEDQAGAHLVLADAGQVEARLGPHRGGLVLTAHSHLPRMVTLEDGTSIVNPGSVGCPAYDDGSTSPPHVSETGSPAARYAIVNTGAIGPMVEFLSVPYAHAEAVARAEVNGRPDWAHALRTGYAYRPKAAG